MTVLACVEVGGSGCQTVLFTGHDAQLVDGAHCPPDAELAIAVPGIIAAGRVVAASNLEWYDVDPAEELGLDARASLVLNDAAAAALGEAALRDRGTGPPDLVLLGLGTGVGGAVVVDGEVVADNLIGHAPGFSSLRCRCGQVGCLETVVSGWALPDEPDTARIAAAAEAVAAAVAAEPRATPRLLVVTGGVATAHPAIVTGLAAALADRVVETTAAPPGAKSASAWGLRLALGHVPSYR